jgi:hypothetical protein
MSYLDEVLNRRCAVRALFRRFRHVPAVVFNEATGEVCDTSCRADAALDRIRTTALLFR